MPNITQWTPSELEHFSHKLEEIISGPDGSPGQVGFIFIAYPLTDTARAKMLSNCPEQTVIVALYKILQQLVGKGPMQ